MTFDSLHVGMHEDFSKNLGKSNLVFRRNVLPADTDDEMLQNRSAQLFPDSRRQLPGQIQPVHIGAQLSRLPLDPDRFPCLQRSNHGLPLLLNMRPDQSANLD